MRLVTKMLANINTNLAAHDTKITALARLHLTMPSDEESDVAKTSSQSRKGPPQARCAQTTMQW